MNTRWSFCDNRYIKRRMMMNNKVDFSHSDQQSDNNFTQSGRTSELCVIYM